MHCAANYDIHNTIFKLFLSNGGFDVDLVLPYGNWTSLYRTIYFGACNNATSLLWHGASINSIRADNKTPMQIAQNWEMDTVNAQRWQMNITKFYRKWMAMRKFDCFV